ncbi:hypothetical protein B0H21DRAFT_801857 [Amylocystis lapponica]|nr:hypothetical protein B0H21DRAFT_801857 [Amylocystis lapponica]
MSIHDMSRPALHHDLPQIAIACINDDILHEIFLQLAANSLFPCGTTIREGTSWISISYVCRYWRAISLVSAQLWSCFYLTERSNVAMVKEFLRRSRQAMLHVTFSGPTRSLHPTDHLVRMAQMLSAHTERIMEFELFNLYPRETDAILSSFTSPAPHLQKLVIRSIAVAYHHTLFGGSMPLLREISLAGVATSWLPYKNLTMLTIFHQEAPSMADLLWTLVNCPAVEELLVGFFTMSEVVVHHPEPELTIALHRLKRLTITSRPDHVLSILAHLSFPPTTAVSLTFSGIPHSAENIFRYSRRCPSLSAIAANVQHAVLEERFGACLRSADSRISLKWQWGREPSDPLYTGFAATLFPALQHLSVDYACTTDQWTHILSHLPTLVSIAVHAPARDMTALFDALGQVPRQDLVRGILCPVLACVSVSQLDAFWSGEYIFERVVACFLNRAAAAYRLASFQMPFRTEIIFPPALLEELAAVVDKVEVQDAFHKLLRIR